MIEKFIVSELDTIAELNHQLYPVAAPVGELEGSFCIYTRVSGEVQRDLMQDTVTISLINRPNITHRFLYIPSL